MTDRFVATAREVAAIQGLPDYPFVVIEHPIAGNSGEELRAKFVASGEIYYVISGAGESRNGADTIEWGEGDVFCFPGGGESVHRAEGRDCLLFCVTNEPLLAFERLRAPLPGQAAFEATHWPAQEIERQFQDVYDRPDSDNTTGHSVQFSTAAMAPAKNEAPRRAHSCSSHTRFSNQSHQSDRHQARARDAGSHRDGKIPARIHQLADEKRRQRPGGGGEVIDDAPAGGARGGLELRTNK